jgi:hypothetical protein
LGEAASVILAIISILFFALGEFPFFELSCDALTCLSLNFTLDLLILIWGCTTDRGFDTGGGWGLVTFVFPLTIFKLGIAFSKFELLTAVELTAAADVAVPLLNLITD